MSVVDDLVYDQEMIDIFMEEAEEILLQLEEDLLLLEKEPGEKSVIDRVFRSVHTLKGSAGLTGILAISNFAHMLEDVLDKYRKEEIAIPDNHMMVILDGLDLLKRMVGSIGTDAMKELVEHSDEISELLRHIADTNVGIERDKAIGSTGSGEKQRYKISLSFEAGIFKRGTDPLLLIDELSQIGGIVDIAVGCDTLPGFAEFDPHILYLYWTILFDSKQSVNAVREVFIFVEEALQIEVVGADHSLPLTSGRDNGKPPLKQEPEELGNLAVTMENSGSTVAFKKASAAQTVQESVKQSSPEKGRESSHEDKEISTIRVETKKLERIMDQVAELAIAQLRIKNMFIENMDGNVDKVDIIFEDVTKITRLLQEEVMRASMVPIGGTFTRFQRMVRDLAKEKGKLIELEIRGKETELDRKVTEQITDPLKHMIRNSIDHGIESPAEREKAGKDPTGRIYLKAYYQEGGIVIEVADDGKGLDTDGILEKAKKKGLVTEDQVLSREEIFRLTFLPGFSTAKQVSDISGRGVGLDVVYNNINALRGHVDLDSEKGRGTRFLIRLPLTLAIIDVIMVSIGGEKVLIPTSSVVEFLTLAPENLKNTAGKMPLVYFRGNYVPLVSMSETLGLHAYAHDNEKGMIAVVQDQRRQVAFWVDEILGQEQVVVKSMKDNLGHVEGVEGATVLGDGKVAMILDVPSTIKLGLKSNK